MHYRQRHEPRLTISSVMLLVVFISAFAFIVSAIVWQPWNASDTTSFVPSAVIDAPAADGLDGDLDVLVQPLE